MQNNWIVLLQFLHSAAIQTESIVWSNTVAEQQIYSVNRTIESFYPKSAAVQTKSMVSSNTVAELLNCSVMSDMYGAEQLNCSVMCIMSI